MANEVITLVKDTSLARIISFQEVTLAGYAFLKGSHGYSPHLAAVFHRRLLSHLQRRPSPFLLGRLERPAGILPLRGAARMSILEVKDLEKHFNKTQVLNGISFTLEKGQALTIIGSSGSGKTTLLRCLNFLETPDGGSIAVNGETLFDAADPATRGRRT